MVKLSYFESAEVKLFIFERKAKVKVPVFTFNYVLSTLRQFLIFFVKNYA